jgi:formylglycine-generating enzyme required for sulfatase activity
VRSLLFVSFLLCSTGCSVELNRFSRRDAGNGDTTKVEAGGADGRVAEAAALDAAVPGTWAAVAAGTFLMGSPSTEPCRNSDETQHSVTLTRAFSIMTTEVTQRQYQDVIGQNPSQGKTCLDCPVNNVTWHEAAAFCNALSQIAALAPCYSCSAGSCAEASAALLDCPGYRLPTEAEWEYAYRGGTSTAFPNGPIASCTTDSNLDAIGWYKDNAGGVTHPAAQKQPNAWGLYDMAGNVLEWVNDRYAQSLGSAPLTDPVGPASGTDRVQRGGSYSFNAEFARAAGRMTTKTGEHYDDFGFRVARTAPK